MSAMSDRAVTLEEIRERNVWQLAHDAGVSDPDRSDSPGALFLLRVVRDVLDVAEDTTRTADWDDLAHELADSLVPIYTHERMLVMVDLAAYLVDVDDYGIQTTDMVEIAGVALYEVARTLIASLAEEIEATDAADDEDETHPEGADQ